ncbi:hypothetical protein Y032_0003g1427 [Ancylostoma ceylanicum]|uniref:Reticulocalbin-3 n=1 Tax=Ancylostoma ceylanicum TaxID=53326 RepID=A0A016VXV4_9BILA|nr:hypothetical protein Y032_0003g1427 [Ancylostoma ceylanicum]
MAVALSRPRKARDAIAPLTMESSSHWRILAYLFLVPMRIPARAVWSRCVPLEMSEGPPSSTPTVKMKWMLLILLLPLVAADKEREVDGAAARIHKHLGGSEDDHEGDHQAILGSRKTAEEFDDMPIEESKRRLEILARKMDMNEDGFIDESELTNWVERSMVSLDEEEVNERMTEMDTDGDKLVSWDEYVADSFPEQDIKKLDPDDKKLMEEDARYFKAADLNADGKLSKEELSAFLNPENYRHMHKTLVEVTMKEKDLNNDGAIDLKEFLGEMADNSQSEWHKVESDRLVSYST